MATKPIKTGSTPARQAAPDNDRPAAKQPPAVKRGGDQRFAGLRTPRSAAAAGSPKRLAALPEKALKDVAAARLSGRYPPHVVESAADAALRGLRRLHDAVKKGTAG